MPGEAAPEEALALFRVPPPLPPGTRPSWPAPEAPEPATETDPDDTDPDEIDDDAIVIEQVAAAYAVAPARSSWKSLAIAFAAGVFAGAVMVMTVS
jgi:hypothetical protein